jgi:hypothetical protein
MASNTFIARGIAGLEIPEKGSVEYFDSSTPGFGLRVTSRGHQSWICLYRHRGEKRRYTIGTYPQLGLADAREEAKEVLRRAAKGEDPAMEKKWQRKAKTFRELADLYLEHHAKATKESSGNNRTIWTAGRPGPHAAGTAMATVRKFGTRSMPGALARHCHQHGLACHFGRSEAISVRLGVAHRDCFVATLLATTKPGLNKSTVRHV